MISNLDVSRSLVSAGVEGLDSREFIFFYPELTSKPSRVVRVFLWWRGISPCLIYFFVVFFHPRDFFWCSLWISTHGTHFWWQTRSFVVMTEKCTDSMLLRLCAERCDIWHYLRDPENAGLFPLGMFRSNRTTIEGEESPCTELYTKMPTVS